MAKTLMQLLDHPFNADRQLKYKLSSDLWGDANDFNHQIDILLNNLPYDSKSYLGKIFVLMLFSAECSLKSLIVSLSKKSENPEDAYLIGRNKSHDIIALCNEVQNRAKNRVKFLSKKDIDILKKANKLGVSTRYYLPTFFLLTSENRYDRFFEKGVVSSTINQEFLKSLYDTVLELSSIASKSYTKYNFKDAVLSGKNLGKLEIRYKSFYSTLKKMRKI